jgi:hypothetical protein
MLSFLRTALFACLGWLINPALASAQAAIGAPSNTRPIANVAHIAISEAPTIDADLSDPVWAKATFIGELKQRLPNPGAPPTERTVVRVMYDENKLYFSIYAYDGEPDLLVVRAMARDGPLYTGDNVQIMLDPGLTRRNVYAFTMGPSGGRWDGLRLNRIEELPQWDTIWEGRARRVADGWVAEVAIPFRSISYVEGQSDWGFEFQRTIRRKAEVLRWSSTNPAISNFDYSESGTLTGITGVSQGLGLDIQPYVALRSKHDWQAQGDGAGISATAGGNAFYKITPSLTGTLTVNPDFSDAPLDIREVNTTRFSLFLPETRDFFLQDAGAFEFGGRPFRREMNDRLSANGRPFFSRNLGLVRGQQVSLIGGGKISGEHDGFGIGGLSVLTDRTPTSEGQLLSVLRITQPVFSQSKMGFIVTNGDPTGLTQNTVVGADFQYRDTTTFDATFQTDVYYERSYSNKVGDDNSYGLAFNYPNEPWFADFTVKEVGKNFAPALGFVNRNDIRLYDGTFGHRTRYRDRRDAFRTIDLYTRQQFFTDLDNRLQSRESRVGGEILTATDHTLAVDAVNSFERLTSPFTVPGNIVIPKGPYEWTNIFVHLQTSNGLPVAFVADLTCCSYYDGSIKQGHFQVNYRPSEYYEVQVVYDPSFIALPGGDVDIHVLSANAIVNFTPDMQLVMQAQYDNVSENFGFLGRFRWEFRPGSEIFVALGQSALIPGQAFRAQVTQFSFRIGHTLQF